MGGRDSLSADQRHPVWRDCSHLGNGCKILYRQEGAGCSGWNCGGGPASAEGLINGTDL